ncbi:hypothetical protein ABE178_15385 [Priestia megaterium]
MNRADLELMKECEHYLVKLRGDLDGVTFPEGMIEYAIACPRGIYDLVMELKKMYLETKKDTDIYTIYLKSYDHVFAIKTNDYSKEIAGLLDWAYSSYQIMSVVKNAEIMEKGEYLFTPKSELLEDLQFKVEAYCFEEPDEVIAENIERIKQLLVDENE